jgi:hypothetical protein
LKWEVAKLRKQKQHKPKKSLAEALLRDMQGTAAEKLALFEKLKVRGGSEGTAATHSGRVGVYTAASEAGIAIEAVAALARHKSLNVAQKYARNADRLKHAPPKNPALAS